MAERCESEVTADEAVGILKYESSTAFSAEALAAIGRDFIDPQGSLSRGLVTAIQNGEIDTARKLLADLELNYAKDLASNRYSSGDLKYTTYRSDTNYA